MTRGPATRFRHEAVLYAGAGDLVRRFGPWVEEGLEVGDPVVALVTARSRDALRDGLGPAAAGVAFADMGEAGRNPARIISVWKHLAAAHARPGRTLRAIGEPVWPGRSHDELVECRHHETLLNHAFAAEEDLWLLCPYDVGALHEDVVGDVAHTHPVVVDRGDRVASATFRADQRDVLRSPLPEPGDVEVEMVVETANLKAARNAVARQAAACRLSPRRAHDLVLAVNEVATNSILHGGGTGLLRSWRAPDAVVHEVRDQGRIDDALVGRRRPTPEQFGGRGLWLVNELCDLVQLRSAPGGTVVRVHMRTG